MEHISKLMEIARFLNLNDIEAELKSIELRASQQNACIVLPLVGEFSSGKTTLINALTDNKKLETATEPTTATIYEVHFGCDRCCAAVINENGNVNEVEDIAELKNKTLGDAEVVSVFDTSTKVPASTIIVDTPGLSSPNPKHKQTLVNFLPKADGILLVIDINQQVTRSLTDFIKTIKLSMRPIFLVLTKSDTKSPHDIEAAKKYIGENCEIPLKQIAVVSAIKDNMNELYTLLNTIQKEKNQIIKQVDEQRIKNIANTLTEHIDELTKASSSDKDMEEALRRAQYDMDKIGRNIDHLIESVGDDIADEERTISRKFEDTIFERLNTLVVGKSNDFDTEAVSSINSTASLLMSEYKSKVQEILRTKAQSRKGADDEVYISSIESVDMSGLQITGLNYNLDLNNMGHEYDGWIKTGVIAAAAVGLAVGATAIAGAGAAGSSSAAGAANTAGEVVATGKLIDMADTVSDVGSIISNSKTMDRMEKVANIVGNASQQYGRIESVNRQIGTQNGGNKGLIDSMIGFATDKLVSKPQRVRAIRMYIDGTLAPDFKNGLNAISQNIIACVRETLNAGASNILEQKRESLNQLRAEMQEKKNLFNEKMDKLREYKTILLTM